MKVKKKIALAACIFFLLFVTSAAITALYYYTHPTAIKGLIERTVSGSTGTSFTVKDLSYSFNPLRISARGVSFRPRADQRGFSLEIPGLSANMSLEGRFGQKSLVFKKLKVDDFSFRMSQDSRLPMIEQEKRPSSFLGGLLKRLIALFLFKDFRLQGAELARGSIDLQLEDQGVHVRGIHLSLKSDHSVGLSCAVEIKWPARGMSLSVPHLYIETDRAISLVDPEIGYSLTAQRALFECPEARLEDIGIKAQGSINLNDRKLDVRHLHLTAADILDLEGALDGNLGVQKAVQLRIVRCEIFPRKLLSSLAGRMKKPVPGTLSGIVRLSGRLHGLQKRGEWIWKSELLAGLKQNRFSCATGAIRVNGMVTGEIRAAGRLPELKTSAILKAENILLSGKGLELKPSEAAISVSGTYPLYMIKDLAVHIPRARGRLGKRKVYVDDVRLQAKKCRVDVESRSVSLPKLQVETSLLKNLLISLNADQGVVVAGLKGNRTGLIRSAQGLNLFPPGWELSGIDVIEIGAILNKKGKLSFSSNLLLRELAFQDRDAGCVGEKISLRAEIKGEMDPSSLIISADTTLKADNGEILYDRFYHNLSNNPMFSSCEGTYNPSSKHLHLSSLELGLREILALNIRGGLFLEKGDQHIDLEVNIPKTDIKPIFSSLVQEPFQTEKPVLTSLDIGGSISAGLRLKGAWNDWSAKGRSVWLNGELSLKDKELSLKGIDLDLPLWYRNLKGKGLSADHKGRLSIRSMTLPVLPEQALALSLDSGPNSLFVRSPTILEVPGGEVRVGPVEIKGLFQPPLSIQTSFTIGSVEIGALLAGMWPQSVQGTIRGRPVWIHLKGSDLSSTGELKARVFGGEIVLSDLGASGIFTPAPIIGLSARLDDLSLGALTRGTSFGKIEGVLRGYINDLEISNGQPQRFDLMIETIKKRGVSQRISVKAVDNIARIGAGQSPFVGFAGLFASLFKEFPYEKIGVHATLENDVFRINGTVRDGETEYLVKRSFFSGVSVVNQNPDNRVSFRDMIKRIGRIKASKSGPVVR